MEIRLFSCVCRVCWLLGLLFYSVFIGWYVLVDLIELYIRFLGVWLYCVIVVRLLIVFYCLLWYFLLVELLICLLYWLS